jgi:hypothetical protein
MIFIQTSLRAEAGTLSLPASDAFFFYISGHPASQRGGETRGAFFLPGGRMENLIVEGKISVV